jgi:hypothetical protein
LSRIEKDAFEESGLIEIEISSSVEILGDDCFVGCGSLSGYCFELLQDIISGF